MPKIAISYRRADTEVITGRIFDRLIHHYGRESIFRDIDNIPPGFDFRDYIDQALGETDILLVILGRRWLGSQGGKARIADETDPVRIEVETATRRGIPVIPVLIGTTKMPKPAELPEPLKGFAFRNALKVDPGADFDHHTERLIRRWTEFWHPRKTASQPGNPSGKRLHISWMKGPPAPQRRRPKYGSTQKECRRPHRLNPFKSGNRLAEPTR